MTNSIEAAQTSKGEISGAALDQLPSKPRAFSSRTVLDAKVQQEQAEILARAQAGDHHAFAQLYTLHKRRIYSLCLSMVGGVAEAEDLTQEAFLQLHRKIGTFRGESALSTWLHRLAVNVVLMQRNSGRARASELRI
jgi:hypothetical protein